MKTHIRGLIISLAAFSALGTVTALAQTVGSADIIDGSIQAIDIAPESITSGRIQNGAIQAHDLAPNSITSGRIQDGSIQAIDIAPNAISTGRIQDGSIQAIDIAPETITSGRIQNGSIQAIDIAPETITSGRIQNGSIQAIDIAPNAITTCRIQDGAVQDPDLSASLSNRIPPATDVLNIAAVSMVPRNYLKDGESSMAVGNACEISVASVTALAEGFADEADGFLANGSAQYYANVALPNGATVTAFRSHVFDNNNGDHPTIGLYRRGFAPPATPTDAPEQMADASTSAVFASADITEVEDTTIDRPLVANDEYYYFVVVDLGCDANSAVEVLGVQVEFTR